MADIISDLVGRLADQLDQTNRKMAAAESCTGGWISKVCTDLPGSSGWFERGFITYSNDAKMELLGVQLETLEEYGAVSRQVAEEMAGGALARAPVDAALAVTGVAGPDGGTTEKPVGTVWFAWAVSGTPLAAECVRFEGNRDGVRRQTVAFALDGLLNRL